MINSIPAVSEVNCSEVSKQKRKSPFFDTKIITDTLLFSRRMSENMKFKNKGGLNRYDKFYGELNTSPSEIIVSLSKGRGKSMAKGIIGDIPIFINYSNNNYVGRYGNNEFNLHLEKNSIFRGTELIKGTINRKEVEFNLKGDKIPEGKDIQDILTAVLLLNGESARTYGDNFIGTKPSGVKQ